MAQVNKKKAFMLLLDVSFVYILKPKIKFGKRVSIRLEINVLYGQYNIIPY